jgi:hypothetical protein
MFVKNNKEFLYLLFYHSEASKTHSFNIIINIESSLQILGAQLDRRNWIVKPGVKNGLRIASCKKRPKAANCR